VVFPLVIPPALLGARNGILPAVVINLNTVQLVNLRNGAFYVNLHSSAFVDGEIRGQIYPAAGFQARLEGRQQVPPVQTGATGEGARCGYLHSLNSEV